MPKTAPRPAARPARNRALAPVRYQLPDTILALMDQVVAQNQAVQQRVLGWLEGQGIETRSFSLRVTRAHIEELPKPPPAEEDGHAR